MVNIAHLKTLNVNDQKNYLRDKIIPLTTGYYAVMNAHGEYEIKDQTTVSSVYFNRMSSEIKKWIKSEVTPREICCVLYEDTLFTKSNDKGELVEYFNVARKFKHIRNPYSKYSKKTKKAVDKMITFLKDVWCANGNPDVHLEYLLDWFANMIQGNKNDSIIACKSTIQGIGKSTFADFIHKHVIGDDLTLLSGASNLVKDFNAQLEGKLFVYFEELQVRNEGDWHVASSVLKRNCTSDYISIEKKGKDAFQVLNHINYLINTNFNIKGDDGRRFYIVDLSTKYKGNHEYWNDLHKKCFNDEVGEAFYNMMMERDVSKFNAQKDMPETEAKKIAILERLDHVARFLKYYTLNPNKCYELQDKTLTDIYELFTKHCVDFNLVEDVKKIKLGIRNFSGKLKEYGIHQRGLTIPPYRVYNIEHEKLIEQAKKHSWLDDVETKMLNDLGIREETKSEKKERLQAQIKALQDELESLEEEEDEPLEDATNEVVDDDDKTIEYESDNDDKTIVDDAQGLAENCFDDNQVIDTVKPIDVKSRASQLILDSN